MTPIAYDLEPGLEAAEFTDVLVRIGARREALGRPISRRVIARELIRRTSEAAGPETSLIPLSAQKAETYYPRVGLTRHESRWVVPRAR